MGTIKALAVGPKQGLGTICAIDTVRDRRCGTEKAVIRNVYLGQDCPGHRTTQTDRQAGRQIVYLSIARQTDRQSTDRQTDRQSDRQTDRQACRQADKQRDKQTDGQAQTDRETERESD